jgi:hypothetical protein
VGNDLDHAANDGDHAANDLDHVANDGDHAANDGDRAANDGDHVRKGADLAVKQGRSRGKGIDRVTRRIVLALNDRDGERVVAIVERVVTIVARVVTIVARTVVGAARGLGCGDGRVRSLPATVPVILALPQSSLRRIPRSRCVTTRSSGLLMNSCKSSPSDMFPHPMARCTR